jgi:hypothetical protein
MRTYKSWGGLLITCGLLLWMGVPAAYGQIALGGGWEASVDEGVGIVVSDVTLDYLVIEISKDFTDPPGVGGVFPAKLIDFHQVAADADTVPRIIIEDESITNLTGVPWTDYHWALLNGGETWFNRPLSDPINTTPFGTKVWSDTFGFGDPDKMTDLAVSGGVVPSSSSFFPGAAPGDGELVIDIDLSFADPMWFTLKQFPTPEPASLAMLAFGGLVVVMRRRR